MTIAALRLLVDVAEQPLQRLAGEEEAVGLVVGAVDRHADVVQQRASGDHDLGVADGHPVVGDHRRLDVRPRQQPQQPQRDVEDDLHVDPGVVRHPQPLGVDLRHVPPGAHLLVVVDRLEEALQAPVAAGRRPAPCASAIASRGALRAGPSASGAGTASFIAARCRFASGSRRERYAPAPRELRPRAIRSGSGHQLADRLEHDQRRGQEPRPPGCEAEPLARSARCGRRAGGRGAPRSPRRSRVPPQSRRSEASPPATERDLAGRRLDAGEAARGGVARRGKLVGAGRIGEQRPLGQVAASRPVATPTSRGACPGHRRRSRSSPRRRRSTRPTRGSSCGWPAVAPRKASSASSFSPSIRSPPMPTRSQARPRRRSSGERRKAAVPTTIGRALLLGARRRPRGRSARPSGAGPARRGR